MFNVIVLLQTMFQGVLVGALYGLGAVGLTLIFGVMKLMNIAHGELVMLGSYVTFYMFTLAGVSPFLGVVFAMPILFLLGIVLHKVVMRHLIGKPLAGGMIITLGVSLFIQGLAIWIFLPWPRSIFTPLTGATIPVGPFIIPILRSMVFIVALASIIPINYFIKKRELGMAMRAVAEDPVAAAVVGIDISKVYMVCFAMSVALAGMAGWLISIVDIFAPALGLTYVIKSITIIALGGVGRPNGAFVGGILLGVVEAAGTFFFTAAIRDAMAFVLLFTILMIRPTGLFGTRE